MEPTDAQGVPPEGGAHAGLRALAFALVWLGGMVAGGFALLALYVGVAWLRLPDVGELGAHGDPGPTAFMRGDSCEQIEREYVPLEQIDPRIGCTVVWSEDWRFFRHRGVDENALRGALRANWKARTWRLGGSTIPMQLARNLFLSRSRTLSRKAKEMALARRLVETYDRRRLLELYLNAVELAPCVYGVGAASKHYFGHGADVLDPAEAAFLAAMLPHAGRASGRDADRARTVERQQQLLTHLARAGLLKRRELRGARMEVVAGWRDGWAGHRPIVPGPAPQAWYERACGTLGWPQQRQKPAEF